MKFTLEQVRDKISEYGDTLISTEYKNYRQKLQIKCHKCEEEYEQSYQMILKGYWCTGTCRSENYMSRDKSNTKYGYTYDEVRDIVNSTNNTLCSKEYVNGKSKLDIYCNDCKKVFSMSFYHFNILKQRCPHCYIATRKLTTDTFEEYVLSRGDTLLDNYTDSRTKIRIECGKCNRIFSILANGYRQGAGCQPCVIDQTRLTYDEVKNRIECYGDKLISLEYINTCSPLKIQCGNCNQIFEKNLTSTYRPFCKFCNSTKLEKQMMMYLKKYNLEFVDQKMYKDCLSEHNKQFRFDFYLPNENIIIECDGEQHFKPLKFRSKNYDIEEWFHIIQERDKLKTRYCIENGIKIIRISYKEMKNFETFEKIMDESLIKIETAPYVFSNDKLYKHLIEDLV